MNKREMIFGIAGAIVGSAAGFLIGYKMLEKKVQKEHEEKLQREVDQLSNREDTDEDISGKNYTEIHNVFKEYEVNEDPAEQETDEEEDSMEDNSDDIEVTVNHKHHAPKVLGKSQIDVDDPDLRYSSEELYYFMGDDVLTDSDGNIIDEVNTIGRNPRRYGFMKGSGDLDGIWVRNYDYETDYLIHRDPGTHSEYYFGEA